MTSYTNNTGLIVPTPNDPAVANVWGALWNENAQLLDSIIAGVSAVNVAGSSNIILTFNNGAASQTDNAIFNCTGTLTGAVAVLFPGGKSKVFVAANRSSGGFALSFGVNNGSGGAAGATATLPQGAIGTFYSDGTNVYLVAGAIIVGTTVPGLSGGGTATLGTGGSACTPTLPLSGQIATVTVSASGPSGSGVVGALWVQTS